MQAQSTTWSSAELTSHSPWIRSLALHLVRDAAQADDLVQETFLAALERRPEKERSLRPWLSRVLRNQAALWRRGEARRREREHDRTPAEPLPSSDELLERAELHGAIVQALTRLREPYRSVVLLRYYEGYEPSEIARRQGVLAATVRSQLKRGLDELRTLLDGRFGDDRRRWAMAAVPLAARAEVPAAALGVAVWIAAAAAVVILGAAWMVARPRAEATAEATELRVAAKVAGVAGPTEASILTGGAGEARSPVVTTLPGQEPQSAPITGLIQDRQSGVPVPHYAMRVKDDQGEAELIWTDAEGRFESERSYPAGNYALSYIDHPELNALLHDSGSVKTTGKSIGVSLLWDPENAPLELKASVGPTYRLAITAPFSWDSVPLQGSLKPTVGALWDPRPTTRVELAPLRRSPLPSHDGPWIRFARLFRSLPLDQPWLLRVETADGLWAGEAQVPADEEGSSETVATTTRTVVD